MLAYIFWHWPRPGVAWDEYVERQSTFHQALADRGPTALRSSAIWRVTGAPWTPTAIAYEDWYLLESSAGLDALNAAAVSDALRGAHDAAAALSDGGVGALYLPGGPRAGLEPAFDGRLALWFGKPEGMRYSAVYGQLRPNLSHVWTRMLTLGPSPEFMLLEDSAQVLPPEWRVQMTRRELIWPATPPEGLDALDEDDSPAQE